jgi:HEAT repeats
MKMLANILKPNVKKLESQNNVRRLSHLVLRHGDKRVRGDSAEALGRIGGSPALECLLAAAGDKESDVRCSVAKALGQIGDDAAVDVLSRMLTDDRDRWCVAYAGEALWRLGETGQRALYKLADRVTGDARRELICKLANAIGKPVGNLVLSMLSSHPMERDETKRLGLRWIFGKQADLVADAFSYFDLKTGTAHGTTMVQKQVASASDEPVRRICEMEGPWSNDLLHLLTKKKDTVAQRYDRADVPVSFAAQRELAKQELENRGRPPYEKAKLALNGCDKCGGAGEFRTIIGINRDSHHLFERQVVDLSV